MNIDDYTKDELLEQAVKQFEVTNSVINLLRTLTDDNATGNQRAGTRIIAREFIKDFDRAMEDARK